MRRFRSPGCLRFPLPAARHRPGQGLPAFQRASGGGELTVPPTGSRTRSFPEMGQNPIRRRGGFGGSIRMSHFATTSASSYGIERLGDILPRRAAFASSRKTSSSSAM